MAGLYVHVPFCSQRCVYCDFYVTTTQRDEGAYVRALVAESERVAAEYRGRAPLTTLYLGGGTPSLLSPDALAAVVGAVHDHWDTAGLTEVTVEANPEDLAGPDGAAWLRAVRDLGATRVSLGVQSFFDDDLAFMTRAHSAAQAEAGVAAAVREIGDVSVDLIFGVPDQPFEHWGANLQKAVRLGASHISTYSLTVEDRTPLRRLVDLGRVVPEGDEVLRDRFLFTHDYLGERGFEHYEVSSFSVPAAVPATTRGTGSTRRPSVWGRAPTRSGVRPGAGAGAGPTSRTWAGGRGWCRPARPLSTGASRSTPTPWPTRPSCWGCAG